MRNHDLQAQALLAYFGEHQDHPCGNCDTRLDLPETWTAQRLPAALSAAFRTEQRFGVNHLIEVLRGTNNDRLFQYGHQKLPVYGIGQDLNNNQWRSVFRQLVVAAI